MHIRDTGSISERFMSKVIRQRYTNCWLWSGSIGATGYGKASIGNEGWDHAHRVSYRLFKGPIPNGLTIDHLCRKRSCVNPRHLEAVSFKENILRGTSTSALRAKQTHCKHGHEFTPSNTRINERGHRACRTCIKAYYYEHKPQQL